MFVKQNRYMEKTTGICRRVEMGVISCNAVFMKYIRGTGSTVFESDVIFCKCLTIYLISSDYLYRDHIIKVPLYLNQMQYFIIG